jgi:hypothetical protein
MNKLRRNKHKEEEEEEEELDFWMRDEFQCR